MRLPQDSIKIHISVGTHTCLSLSSLYRWSIISEYFYLNTKYFKVQQQPKATYLNDACFLFFCDVLYLFLQMISHYFVYLFPLSHVFYAFCLVLYCSPCLYLLVHGIFPSPNLILEAYLCISLGLLLSGALFPFLSLSFYPCLFH